MNDYDKLKDEINERCMQLCRNQSSEIEDKIKQVLIDYNCKPSEIELEVHPQFVYKIKINACQFQFDYNFKVGMDDD